jgi:hypothetical protein
MASYTYTGEGARDFPTLVLTLNPGDTFDAPADFVAADVVPASSKKATPVVPAATPAPSASSDSTVGA